MTISKTQQGVRISDIKNNHLVSMQFIGYTLKQARREFKRAFKTA